MSELRMPVCKPGRGEKDTKCTVVEKAKEGRAFLEKVFGKGIILPLFR